MKILVITLMSMMFFISSTSHPLLMVLMILMQTLIISYLINKIYLTFWTSYILILIFLGGMLVLFIYIASLTSSENFSFNKSTLKLTFPILLMVSLNKNEHNLLFPSKDFNSINIKMNNPLSSMTSMFNENMMLSTLIMAIFLMITLLIIVKICNINKAPLKKK